MNVKVMAGVVEESGNFRCVKSVVVSKDNLAALMRRDYKLSSQPVIKLQDTNEQADQQNQFSTLSYKEF